MEFDLELFKKLSKEVLYYMPKQLNWRAPRATSYLLYDLDVPDKGHQIYNTQFPKWRELKNDVFEEIRRVENLPVPKRFVKLYYLSMMKDLFVYLSMKRSVNIVILL